MDKKEFYYRHIMPKINALKYSFPYFASKENRTLYVMIPTSHPMVSQTHANFSNIENCSTEEEILPDFRCKICSITIFNYTDFKIHMREHETTVEGIQEKPIPLETYGNEQLENQKNILKSSQENVANYTKFNEPGEGYLSRSPNKSVNLVAENEDLPRNTPTKQLVKEQKKNMILNNFVNSIIPLKNVEDYKYSKLEESSEIQDKKLNAEHKKLNVAKLSSFEVWNKFDSHVQKNRLPIGSNNVLVSVKNNFSEIVASDEESMNSPLIKKLDPHKPLREGKKNAYIADPSIPITTLKLTYTGLQEIKPCDEKSISVTKPCFDDINSRFESVEHNTKELNLNGTAVGIFSEDKQTVVSDSFSKSEQLDDIHVKKDPTIAQIGKHMEITNVEKIDKSIGNVENILSGINQSKLLGIKVYNSSKSLTNAKKEAFQLRKTYESQFMMTKHLLQHKETKIICCVLCKSSFSCISSLRKHLRMYHCDSKDRRKCPHCNYRCYQTSDLEKHISRRHTRDFKYKCSSCIKGFITPKELRKHRERKHSKQKSNE